MLNPLVFDKDDKIVERRLRSRIKENFTFDDLVKLEKICLSNRYSDNNEKVDKINEMLIPMGFVELGAGTNRYALLKNNYVFKISLDHYGYDDNNTEFDMCAKLLKYGATKTYESNGLIAVAQYVNVISLQEFRDNKSSIREMLAELARDYLFADLGTVEKNFRNWGWDDEKNLCFLDYGYIFERDENLLRCTYCGHRIGYDMNYNLMECSHCGRAFKIHDIKTLMEADDEEREKIFEEKEVVQISFDPDYNWKKDEFDKNSILSFKKG